MKILVALLVTILVAVVAVKAQRPNLMTNSGPKLQVVELDSINGGHLPNNTVIVGFSCVQPANTTKPRCFALAQDAK